jgi:hypothetical protein
MTAVAKLAVAATALAAMTATPVMASYTECAVTKETRLAIRPNGPDEPRWLPVPKGGRVAYRNRFGS